MLRACSIACTAQKATLCSAICSNGKRPLGHCNNDAATAHMRNGAAALVAPPTARQATRLQATVAEATGGANAKLIDDAARTKGRARQRRRPDPLRRR